MQENAGGAHGTEKQRKKKASEPLHPLLPPSNNYTAIAHDESSYDNSARSKHN